jgi:hypothetical protein
LPECLNIIEDLPDVVKRNSCDEVKPLSNGLEQFFLSMGFNYVSEYILRVSQVDLYQLKSFSLASRFFENFGFYDFLKIQLP